MGRYMPLVGLCLAVFLVMTGMGMAVSVLPDRYLEVSGAPRSAGWLASIFAVAYMLFQLPAGRLADRHGFRPTLAAGCLLIAASAALYALAASPAAIYLGRFIQGAGEAPVWAAAPALLGRLHPRRPGDGSSGSTTPPSTSAWWPGRESGSRSPWPPGSTPS
jgi:MFS family permease